MKRNIKNNKKNNGLMPKYTIYINFPGAARGQHIKTNIFTMYFCMFLL